jgi:hypothetical protein
MRYREDGETGYGDGGVEWERRPDSRHRKPRDIRSSQSSLESHPTQLPPRSSALARVAVPQMVEQPRPTTPPRLQ